MLLAFIRKLFLTAITLILLTLISYNILLRDPLNHFVDLQGIEAYFSYIRGLLQGDFGISYTNGEPIVNQILNVFPATVSLCLAVLILSLVLGLPLGFISAVFRENLLGKTLAILGSLSLAIPVFWLAIVVLYYASNNQWAISAVGELHPIYEISSLTGFRLLDIFLADSPYKLKMMQSMLHHLALPALILAVPATLEVIRFTHQRAEYVMKQNYIRVAQTRGWSPYKVWVRHILPNTLPALIPMIAHNLTLIFAFSMLVENIFSWGGIGLWLINALSVQDYNAISAGVVAIGLFILSIDVLVSIITTLLDPYQKKDWYVK
ncbi:ABC transporter permease [Actinobacillus pleuropneumoniae]|uniref:Peptide transport system permease protein SapB n=1 Tax=Actinobacillus pleuropneumoniae serovar 6 str. Femo TaxID=754256 RepID=A0A828PLB3_ACTPL|nr:ABC transporter permease subunit [Actinobacillus pleuropneumoniae]EFL80117.1 peptide transport system permease protein [Actinobacillus pleuropneumoniae serovar 6 str. Femo]EFM92308.1 Peptide transport system permease protein SapB [Actinobacillus pleuropneumoniae serovar 6 str. Femo]UKH13338.1 ABC transporter permease subunit [Actinobacillus pleuropneumoniae serovar 6 str. Femo]SUU63046.1 peptide transport system permease [Actinobacillus pleuropneumoniae]